MLQLQYFSAWISVDGAELPEYSVQYSEDGKIATCWIASEAGKNFTVNWKDPVRSFVTGGLLQVDGLKCCDKIIVAGQPSEMAQVSYMKTSASSGRLLMFSLLETTDDDTLLNSANSKDIGEIKLDIRKMRRMHCKCKARDSRTVPEFQKIHERSKKAVSHRITLGEEIKSRGRSSCYKTLEHLVTFIFKYRSIELLRANGIAPPNAALKRLPHTDAEVIEIDEDIVSEKRQDSDNAAEIKALEERLEFLRRKEERQVKRVKLEMSSIKIEISGPKARADSLLPKRPKREQRNRPLFVQGEVIDLT